MLSIKVFELTVIRVGEFEFAFTFGFCLAIILVFFFDLALFKIRVGSCRTRVDSC